MIDNGRTEEICRQMDTLRTKTTPTCSFAQPYAKRRVNLTWVHLRTKTLHMHQLGVNLPGACEALCHWRGTIEPLVLNGTLEPLVAADLDLVNMFGNAEWRHIQSRPAYSLSLRRPPGPSGSISPTPSPLCPLAVS